MTAAAWSHFDNCYHENEVSRNLVTIFFLYGYFVRQLLGLKIWLIR